MEIFVCSNLKTHQLEWVNGISGNIGSAVEWAACMRRVEEEKQMKNARVKITLSN